MSNERALFTLLPSTKNYMPLALLAVLSGGFWYYSDVVFNYVGADKQCIEFAENADVKPASEPDPYNKKLFVANKWIKGRYVVVELGQRTAKGNYFQSRLCVLGDGHIMIPGMLGEWQYR